MEKTILINPELLDPLKYDENKVKESAAILLEAEEIKKDAVLMKNIEKYWEDQEGKITSLKMLKEKANNYTSTREERKAQQERERAGE